MKYMIMVYGSQQDYDSMAGKDTGKPVWTAADMAKMGDFMNEVNKDLMESGEWIEAQGLTAPAHARRVQLQKGLPVVTDGPYPETHEVLAGFWLLDCESFDRATEIAARVAHCPTPYLKDGSSPAYVDIRPVDDGPDCAA